MTTFLIFLLSLLTVPVYAQSVESYVTARENYLNNTSPTEALPLAKTMLLSRIDTFSMELDPLLNTLQVDISEIQLGLEEYISEEYALIEEIDSVSDLHKRAGLINFTLRDIASLTRILIGNKAISTSSPVLSNLEEVAEKVDNQIISARSVGNNIELPKSKAESAKKALSLAEKDFSEAQRLLELGTIHSYRQANYVELRNVQSLIVEGNMYLKDVHSNLEQAVTALTNLHNLKPWGDGENNE